MVMPMCDPCPAPAPRPQTSRFLRRLACHPPAGRTAVVDARDVKPRQVVEEGAASAELGDHLGMFDLDATTEEATNVEVDLVVS
jgi:hypothetical protein